MGGFPLHQGERLLVGDSQRPAVRWRTHLCLLLTIKRTYQDLLSLILLAALLLELEELVGEVLAEGLPVGRTEVVQQGVRGLVHSLSEHKDEHQQDDPLRSLPVDVCCVEAEPDHLEALGVEHHGVLLVLLGEEIEENLAVGGWKLTGNSHTLHVRLNVFYDALRFVLPALFIE